MHNPTFESNTFKISPTEMPCVALSAAPYQSVEMLKPCTIVTAVKFTGDQVTGQLTEDTGVMDENSRERLRQFIGDCPQVGHDVDLTLATLSHHGINPPNLHWEIRELASIIIPAVTDLSLNGLTKFFNITAGTQNRPDSPAEVALNIYLALIERTKDFTASTFLKMAHLTALANSPLAHLFSGMAASSENLTGTPGGLDYRLIKGDNERSRPIGINHDLHPIDPEYVAQLLSNDGPLRHQFPRYESRPEQITMARNIAESLNSFSPPEGDPHHLILEAGTGVGKSVAYLLPSIIFALQNDTKIVISTSTIGLQEQLIQKDIPDLLKALEGQSGIDTTRLKYVTLKGKINYLCVRRWEQLSNNESLSNEESITLSKTLTWMQSTTTGDRAEITVSGLQAQIWDQISANNFSRCAGARDGACFYRRAREEAAAANILIVNHALLISDLLFDGTLIPEYGYLIIDEAHNLEEEATRQFGFKLSQTIVDESIEHLSGIAQNIAVSTRASDLNGTHKKTLQLYLSGVAVPISRARQIWSQLSNLLASFMRDSNLEKQNLGSAEIESNTRILSSSRAQPAWSEIEIEWDNFERAMSELGRISSELLQRLEEPTMESLPGYDDLILDLNDSLQRQIEMRRKIAGFVNRPDESMVYWISGHTSTIALNGAPLDVGAQLQEQLFNDKRSVILTSATMAVSGNFDHLKSRLSLQDANELLLGSPFDYQSAVLLCTPHDMPDPSSASYLSKLADTIKDLAEAAGGHTLALFTSHAALRATSAILKESLASNSISVLAQGVDGSPAQLLGQFQDQPQSILLGTASFWEGIDIVNNELRVLVVARLPFNIPTEPVFEARSQLYDNPFYEYAIPQAILRFRQGFGRLIRSNDDRGAVVILDGRVSSKAYGRRFLSSLPPTKRDNDSLQNIGQRVSSWLTCPEK